MALTRAIRTSSVAGTAERDHYRAAVRERGAGSLGWIGTWEGNEWWSTAASAGSLAFRRDGDFAIVVSDPAAREEDLERTIREFAGFATRHGMVPVLYSVHEPVAAASDRLGWTRVLIAEETVLDLPFLAFTGKKFQDIRTALNQGTKQGISTRWTTWAEMPIGLREQVNAISEEWVADKALPEMGFTLGGIAELDDPDVRILLAVDGDHTVHGVTSWMPIHRDGHVVGLTLNFMRRRSGGFRPVMEFLIAQAALDAKEEGLEVLSLSGAPLAPSSVEGPDTPAPGILDSVLNRVGQVLEPAYGFRSLLAFKSKFAPQYLPMYLTVPDPTDLAAVGMAIGRAYLPDTSLRDLVRVSGTLLKG